MIDHCPDLSVVVLWNPRPVPASSDICPGTHGTRVSVHHRPHFRGRHACADDIKGRDVKIRFPYGTLVDHVATVSVSFARIAVAVTANIT